MPLNLPDELNFLQKLETKLFENRVVATTLLLGLLLVGFGLFLFRSGVFEGTEVEVLKSGEARLAEDSSRFGDEADGESRRVTVEIAGAVEKPGVYELLASERVERLLIEAGGLSAEADREWVEKNLNRAAKLMDGQKIYVPRIGESTTSSTGTTGITGRVNLNTASASELESLWGIGEARAKAIIDNRPYASSQELLSKKVVPQNVYERIKEEVVAP